MMYLNEYQKRPECLADYLPWTALVAPGVVLNKDGSFQRTAEFAGLTLKVQLKKNWSRHARVSIMPFAVLALDGRYILKRLVFRRKGILNQPFQTQQLGLSIKRDAESLRKIQISYLSQFIS